MGDKEKRPIGYRDGGDKSGDSGASHPRPATIVPAVPTPGAEGDNRHRSLGKRPIGHNPGGGEGGDSSRRRGLDRAGASHFKPATIVPAVVTPGAEARSLRIKNVNYHTSEQGLRAHFAVLVEEKKILRISLDKRILGGRPSSAGSGIIEFNSKQTAKLAQQRYNNLPLDGRTLVVQFYQQVERPASLNTLFVGNVARQATEEQLRRMFSLYGPIRSLRLHVPLVSKRCYAFVKYGTLQEAQNALDALDGNVFHGQPLAIKIAREKK